MSPEYEFRRQGSYALILGFVLFMLAGAKSAKAQLGLGLVPMRAELHLKPGQEYSDSLKLSSESSEQVRIRGEALDFDIDDKTTPQFERNLPQEAAYSCKSWLTLNPTETEIQKDGFLMVRYTLRVPADVAEGSYNCAAGFTTLPPVGEENGGIGVRAAVRIVTALYIQIGAPEIRGGLKEIKVEPSSTGEMGLVAVVVLENQGHMYFRPTGTLEVLDADGKTVETADFPSIPVLRDREQRFLFPLKTQLSQGHYKLRARVDIGTGEIQEGLADIVGAATPPPSGTASAASQISGGSSN